MIIVSPLIRLVLKTASFVLFAITLAAAFGGKCNPEYVTLPSVLVLALPYLAIATLITGIAWLCFGRFIMAALAAITLFAGWGALKDVTPLSFSKEPMNKGRTFRLITFNCLHLADTLTSRLPSNRAIKYLAESGADIICLQELLNLEDEAEIHNWSRGLMDSLYAAYPYRAGETGIDLKVLSKYPVKAIYPEDYEPHLHPYWPAHRCWRLFEVDIKGIKLPIVNFHMTSYYLSNEEREVVADIKGVKSAKQSLNEFRYEIFPKLGVAFRGRAASVTELIDSTSNLNPIIACGDFNDVAGGWSYNLMRKAGFNDAYSETSFGPINTFNQFLFLFHIDQIFYRGEKLRALKVKRLPLNTSDHYPLEATFEILP